MTAFSQLPVKPKSSQSNQIKPNQTTLGFDWQAICGWLIAVNFLYFYPKLPATHCKPGC
jgi:hypothetical protein